MGRYRYRLRSTGYSSTRYGPCEVCKGQVSDVHMQTVEHEFLPDRWAQGNTTFGHKKCLLRQRRRQDGRSNHAETGAAHS